MLVSEVERRSNPASDRLLLERFCSRIPGFNVQSQCLNDLYRLCEQLDIEVVQFPMRQLHGAALEDDGFRYLYINRLLSTPERVIAGFHEYCHLTSHSLDVAVFKSTGGLWNLDKYERQAQIVGAVALMPEPAVCSLSVEEIMREFSVDLRIAEFRASIRI
jgi:Zn-dependent peptidase ImmA (M78 family)